MSERPAEHNPLDQSAQDAANAARAEAEHLQRLREVEDLKWLMAHVQGRRVMWWLLGLTGTFRNAFVPGDQGSTTFRCGEQNIGQRLIAEIHEQCPEKYDVMVKEQQKDATRRRTRT